jgi:hypothetical protein
LLDDWLSGTFRGEELKSAIAKSIHSHSGSYEVFCYFNGFPHDADVCPDVGYDLCFAEVNTMFHLCGVFGWFSSLVSQMYSEILVPATAHNGMLGLWILGRP